MTDMYTCPRCGDEPLELKNYYLNETGDELRYTDEYIEGYFRYALCPTCDWDGSAIFNGHPLADVGGRLRRSFVGFRDYDLSTDIQMLPEDISRALKVARRLEESKRSRRKTNERNKYTT